MWFTLGKLALKTGAEIYNNKKRAKLLQSEAEVKHMERAVNGEVQLQKVIHEKQSNDLKDEFCLILFLTGPLLKVKPLKSFELKLIYYPFFLTLYSTK